MEEYSVIELLVNNHPGVTSHVVGLFSRRAFNLEGVIGTRIGSGATSKIYLLVKNDDRLDQIVKQLKKLYDVIEVAIHSETECTIFNNVKEI